MCPAAHSSTFSRLISQIGQGPPTVQSANLQQLELYLNLRSFDPPFSISHVRRELFTAWELLLLEPCTSLISMDLIVACMLRDELSLRCGMTHEDVHEYDRLMCKTVGKASQLLKPSLGKSSADSYFASQVLAVLFFRMPGFGPIVIDALLAKPKEAQSPKGFFVQTESSQSKRRSFRPAPAVTEGSLEPPVDAVVATPTVDSERERHFLAVAPDLFNWPERLQLFHQPRESLSVEMVASWTLFLATKDAFFLSFCETFVLCVRRAVPPNEQPAWSAVPAYNLMLSCLMPLLRSAVWWDSIMRRVPGQGVGWVTSLPGYMRVKKTACAVLQANPDVLPLFCHTVFECTNANSLLSVDSCVEHLNLFFANAAVPGPPRPVGSAAPQGLATQSSRSGESLPAAFDYDDFWECFGKLLDSESFQVLLKCCSFLYNNLHLFFGRVRTRLVTDLLGKHFFRLFLHWSPEVRTAFQHVLVYKVLRADRRFLPCFSDSQVMLLYGTGRAKRVPVSTPRVALSAKAAWGKPATAPDSVGDPPASADEVAQLTRSAQRRMALFDRANVVDDEELWSDMAYSSKIDSYVRMCLAFRDDTPATGEPQALVLPPELKVYCEASLEQYALLLIRYYRGVTLQSLDDIPETLSHRMVISEFSEGS